jgi:hypothetical protein
VVGANSQLAKRDLPLIVVGIENDTILPLYKMPNLKGHLRGKIMRGKDPSALNVHLIGVFPNCLVDLSFCGEEMIDEI